MKKDEILKILQERGSYVSGQELCRTFSVSRTAIWKAMNTLKDEGYEIESVPNRGYILKSFDEVYSESGIRLSLETERLGRNILFFEETDSTNLELSRRLNSGCELPEGSLAVAKKQTAGRGRRGRIWESDEDKNIAMSLYLKPDILPEKISMITLVAAMAVSDAVKELTGTAGQIKWPNDIVINKKKCCGILTELGMEMDYIRYVIVGIGLNVNTEVFSEELLTTASSIYLETGQQINRCKLIGKVLGCFEKYYKNFVKRGSLDFEIYNGTSFVQEYNKRLAGNGAEVKVLDPKGEYTGVSKGINETGELLVELSDGRIKNVYAGEVSVRGLYGYV